MSASEKVRKSAYRIVAHVIDDWLADYALNEHPPASVDVRLELERIRDTMRVAGELPTTDGANGAAP